MERVDGQLYQTDRAEPIQERKTMSHLTQVHQTIQVIITDVKPRYLHVQIPSSVM